jgi:hypothetical protein
MLHVLICVSVETIVETALLCDCVGDTHRFVVCVYVANELCVQSCSYIGGDSFVVDRVRRLLFRRSSYRNSHDAVIGFQTHLFLGCIPPKHY